MKPGLATQPHVAPPREVFTELLILADGTGLTHNLTPVMATVLQALNPEDRSLQARARLAAESKDDPAPAAPAPEAVL